MFNTQSELKTYGFDFTRLPYLPLFIINKLVYYLTPKLIITDNAIDYSKINNNSQGMISDLNDGLVPKTCPLYANFTAFKHIKNFRKIKITIPTTIILASKDEMIDFDKTFSLLSSLPEITSKRNINVLQWKDAFSTLTSNGDNGNELIIVENSSHNFFNDIIA
jgi:hypothetical protein